MTLAEAQSMLTTTKAAYLAALSSSASGHGDVSINRQRIDHLSAELTRWERAVSVLTAQAAGTSNPAVVTPEWT